MTFVGPPFTFSFRLLAVNCGAVAQEGTIVVAARAYWIGQSNFFIYNGAVQKLPCPVQHFVFDRLNADFIDKTHVGQNKKFNEHFCFLETGAKKNVLAFCHIDQKVLPLEKFYAPKGQNDLFQGLK